LSPTPGEVWAVKLPQASREMIVVIVGESVGELSLCAVIHTTLRYKVGHIDRWPIAFSDCWRRLA